MVTLFPVQSSMLAAVGYHPQSGTLVVLFNSGRAYEYYGVPIEDYEGLMRAESKGRFMHRNILGFYEWARFHGWRR